MLLVQLLFCQSPSCVLFPRKVKKNKNQSPALSLPGKFNAVIACEENCLCLNVSLFVYNYDLTWEGLFWLWFFFLISSSSQTAPPKSLVKQPQGAGSRPFRCGEGPREPWETHCTEGRDVFSKSGANSPLSWANPFISLI